MKSLNSIFENKNLLSKIFKISIMIVLAAIVLSIVLLIAENITNSPDRTYDLSRIGSWGDAFGGFLNPVLSFLALIGLLGTIHLQRKEIELTREELILTRDELKGSKEANQKLASAAEQQNIENAFFQLFNLFQTNLHTISVQEHTGTKAFESLAEEIKLAMTHWSSDRPLNSVWEHHLTPDPMIGWDNLLKLEKK